MIRPVPAPTSRIGPSAAAGELAPERDVGVVASALDVVPDDLLGRHRNDPCAAPRATSSSRSASIAVYVGSAIRRPSPSSSAASSAALEIGHDGESLGGDAGVLQAQRELGRARAAARHAPHARRDQLEVGVPDPRDVAPVGDAVVEHGEHVVLARVERQRAQDLVCAGRVLDEQDRELAPADLDRLGAAEGGPRALQAGDDVAQALTPSALVSAAAPSAL